MTRTLILGITALLGPHGALAMRMMASTATTATAGAPECSRSVAQPRTGESLREYFDNLRKQDGLLNNDGSAQGDNGLVDTTKCTKKDVCLLMRQLDMDFFKRAREGLLQDADYDIPPTTGWVTDGSCKNQEKVRGFKMMPVMDAERCKRVAAAEKDAVFTDKVKAGGPQGCVVRKTKDKKGATKTIAFLNPEDTGGKAGISYDGTKRYETEVLCEMDRSLEESAAAYYSPYKLKPSMLNSPGKSTSCSFGMYAFLAKLQETQSACASILTYKPSKKFSSAQDALNFAASLQSQGKSAEASQVKAYVETMRQKYVLIDTIANQWCPGVWQAVQAKPGATCDAPRVMSWTAEGQKSSGTSTGVQPSDGKTGATKTGGGGRMGHANGGKRPVPANQIVLNALDSLLAEEDTRAVNIKGAQDEGNESQGQKDSRGKAVKIALTEAACSAFPDETLAQLLATVDEAPPDFFRDAEVAED